MGENKFEEAFRKLEEIVRQMESPDVELDRLLELYEEGRRLAVVCREKLNQAEERIKKLVKKEGGFELKNTDISSKETGSD